MVPHKTTITSIANMFVPNTIIWRGGLYFNRYGCKKLVAFNPKPTEKGCFVLRTQMLGSYLCEPEASVMDVHANGVVTFVAPPYIEEWTHLLVTKAVDKGNNGYMFANFAKPYDIHEYIDFRNKLFHALGRLYTEPVLTHDERIEIANTIWPAEIRKEQRRLIVTEQWSTPINGHSPRITHYDFNYIRQV